VDSVTALGHSLALVDGDLVLQDGRLHTVEGQRNLLQALELRLLTPFGSDPFNTTYGLDATQIFTQPEGPRMVRELIKLNLVRTLGTDPRVRDIREILFEDDPDYLDRHPEVSPAMVRDARHRRAWRVEVTLDTITDETVTLSTALGV
jgi:hypothetical protein